MTLEQIKVAVKKGLRIHYGNTQHTVMLHAKQPGRDPRVMEDEFIIHHDYLRTPLEYHGKLNGMPGWYYPPINDVLGYYDVSGRELRCIWHSRPNRLLMFKGPTGQPIWLLVTDSRSDPASTEQPGVEHVVETAIDVLERHFYGHGHPYTDYPWAANLDVVV